MQRARGLLDSLLPDMLRSEHAVEVHCRREAARQEDDEAARAMLDAARHAERVLPLLSDLAAKAGHATTAGETVGASLTAAGRDVIDLLETRESAYRTALLALRQGCDLFFLARETAVAEEKHDVVAFCIEWLEERADCIDVLERGLSWFADHPQQARELVVRHALGALVERARLSLVIP
jgi:hypothetical protein